MFVTASPTARRADAAASMSATGPRSPMLMACPPLESKLKAATATSLTGTCQGPTICSWVIKPPTLRSPIVIRNFLLATAGRRRTRSIASSRAMPLVSSGASSARALVHATVFLTGLSNSTDIGRSIGMVPNKLSVSTSRLSRVAWPTTASGQRSRSHSSFSTSRPCSVVPRTKRSWDSLHQISIGERLGSAQGMLLSSKVPPKPESWTSSGRALASPPAPTS